MAQVTEQRGAEVTKTIFFILWERVHLVLAFSAYGGKSPGTPVAKPSAKRQES